jgi:hypothetical protein
MGVIHILSIPLISLTGNIKVGTSGLECRNRCTSIVTQNKIVPVLCLPLPFASRVFNLATRRKQAIASMSSSVEKK